VNPDRVTFSLLLAACSHSVDKLDKVLFYLERMKHKYNITPTLEHNCCVVDALMRKGEILAAERMLNEMTETDEVLWMTLLGGCRTKVMQLLSSGQTIPDDFLRCAKQAAERLFKMNVQLASVYVLLGNIYSAVGLHTEADQLRIMMDKTGVKKCAGKAWVSDKKGVCHTFVAHDTSHPLTKQIHQKWEQLATAIEYQPNLAWVLQNESSQQKALRLCRHSEKLALCFALLVIPPEDTIYIVKNLRMCGDCHDTTALISKIEKRRIVVRDAKVFHHFEEGKCSCGGLY